MVSHDRNCRSRHHERQHLWVVASYRDDDPAFVRVATRVSGYSPVRGFVCWGKAGEWRRRAQAGSLSGRGVVAPWSADPSVQTVRSDGLRSHKCHRGLVQRSKVARRVEFRAPIQRSHAL
jgi:hypothetical protein